MCVSVCVGVEMCECVCVGMLKFNFNSKLIYFCISPILKPTPSQIN